MTEYGQFCSVARSLETLGGRWTLLVVRELLCGSRRFNDIRRGIPRVSRTILSERLQALALAGVVTRIDGEHGPEYELTAAGRELMPLMAALGGWGQRWLPRHADTEDLDLEPVLVDMQRRVRLAALPKDPLVARFEFFSPSHAFHAAQDGRSLAVYEQPWLSRTHPRSWPLVGARRLVAGRRRLPGGAAAGPCGRRSKDALARLSRMVRAISVRPRRPGARAVRITYPTRARIPPITPLAAFRGR